jgi:cold-inducible RNA-binding protein
MALRTSLGRLVGRTSLPQKDPFTSCRRGLSTRLFVSGLSFYTTEQSFSEAFSRYGQLVEAKLIWDTFAQRSKGFGFVQYASQEEANAAIEGMDGKFLGGRVIFVEVAKPKSELGRSSPPDSESFDLNINKH